MSDTTTDPKSPHLIDRVVIRFAGDSGDGMQLAGDRFTTSSALFGNDLATFPDFPAEIRAPAGTLAGVSAFQVHISDHDISTPGDSPNVLVAMNPAALRANVERPAPGRHHHRQLGRLRRAQPGQGRLRGRPAGRRLAVRLHRLRGPDDLDHHRVVEGARGQAPRRRALQELLRPRPDQLALHPPGRADPRRGSPRSTPARSWCSRPTSGPSRPATTSARRPSCSSPPTRCKPAVLEPGRVRQRHRQHGGRLGPDRRVAAQRPARCSSAPTRSPRPRTSSTSCPSTSSSGCGPSRPRTRSPASAPPSAPPSAARSASPPPRARASTSSPR